MTGSVKGKLDIDKVKTELRNVVFEGVCKDEKLRILTFLDQCLDLAQHSVDSYPHAVKSGERFGEWKIALTKPHSIDWNYYEVCFDWCGTERDFAVWIAHLWQKVWFYDTINFMRGVLAYHQYGTTPMKEQPLVLQESR